MAKFRIKWYEIILIVILIALSVFSAKGYNWAHITICVLIIVFIVLGWIRMIVQKKRGEK